MLNFSENEYINSKGHEVADCENLKSKGDTMQEQAGCASGPKKITLRKKLKTNNKTLQHDATYNTPEKTTADLLHQEEARKTHDGLGHALSTFVLFHKEQIEAVYLNKDPSNDSMRRKMIVVSKVGLGMERIGKKENRHTKQDRLCRDQ